VSDLEQLAGGTGADARYARRVLKRRAARSTRGPIDGFADFDPLIDALDDLAARIAPGERKKLAGAIATDLRAANAKRERANIEPDGEPMTPRKRKKSGRLRSKRLRDPSTRARVSVRQTRMFQRAAGPRYLRKESSAGAAQVGFVGAMARIMRVHQYGLTDHVTRSDSSPVAQYPARAVLGISADDRARILDAVTAQVAP